MKIVVHDYSGHIFQVHLSRQLAKRGHEVHHLYFAEHLGPKGIFDQLPDDSPSLHFTGVKIGKVRNDVALGTGQMSLERIFQEFAYGREAARHIRRIRPDIVLCGNTPADAQRAMIKLCRREDIPFVYWLQDIYSVAVGTLLAKKLGIFGKAIGGYYGWLDRSQFRASDGIVAISQDFSRLIRPMAPKAHVTVIENWAALADLPMGNKDNAWSRTHGLHDRFTYAYSGTLGRKHNWEYLLKLAQRCGPEETVLVVGQGYGVPKLQAAKTKQTLPSLSLLPLQPAKVLSQVMATADILLATIEADAGTFAVPSKVLSYLCAGRPILMAASLNNLAARTVERANAGIVVSPHDEAGFLAAAERLHADPALRATLGANGRAYAERTFDIDSITDKFETELLRAMLGSVKPAAVPEIGVVVPAK